MKATEQDMWCSPLTGDRLTSAEAWLWAQDFTTTPNEEIYSSKCYICRDPDYAQMGLPLCYPCRFCGGHVAADDCVCDVCGKDQSPSEEEMHLEDVKRAGESQGEIKET